MVNQVAKGGREQTLNAWRHYEQRLAASQESAQMSVPQCVGHHAHVVPALALMTERKADVRRESHAGDTFSSMTTRRNSSGPGLKSACVPNGGLTITVPGVMSNHSPHTSMRACPEITMYISSLLAV